MYLFSGSACIPGLPKIGAIYWANHIEHELDQTLKSLSAVTHVTEHVTWQGALNRYQEFRTELHNYRVN